MAARTELWGDETSKAVENFQISGQTIPAPVIHWLGRLKAAAARANAELGQLDSDLAEKIAKAGDEVANGEHDDQFPIDIFQTGSGTSSNMNANEVIAELAGDAAHPNDHVNMGQSSNDVFPSAVHLAALGEVQSELLPALDGLCSALERKAAQFNDIVKAGRTHLMDAVPVTLGQEFAGFAAQIRLGAERVRSTLGQVGQIPLGGTATGTGLNTHPEFAAKVREKLRRTPASTSPSRPIPSRPRAIGRARRALRRAQDRCGLAAQDRQRPRADGPGPRAGLAELVLPELQKGSSIMPGKVNPVIPEVVIQVADQVVGNDAAITLAGSQGQFELNVRVPLIARNLLDSIKLLSSASALLTRSASAGSSRTRRCSSATPRRRSRPRPRSTPTSVTTAPPRSSKRRTPRGGRCARSPARWASRRRSSSRPSTIARWRVRTTDGPGRSRSDPWTRARPARIALGLEGDQALLGELADGVVRPSRVLPDSLTPP